jgi:hypothetical protein
MQLPPRQRAPCVIRGVTLGAVDAWSVESFRRDFAGTFMWDKDQRVLRAVEDFFVATQPDAGQCGGGGGEEEEEAEESYLFEFLGHECGPAPTEHAARIIATYTVPSHVFGPDIWHLGE